MNMKLAKSTRLRGLRRLEQLEKHLREGTPVQPDFNFAIYSSSREPNVCGTSGCAIGECPGIWPNDWAFGDVDFTGRVVPALRKKPGNAFRSAMGWFALTYEEAEALFIPCCYLNKRNGQRLLPPSTPLASRKDVADRIRTFIKYTRRTGGDK